MAKYFKQEMPDLRNTGEQKFYYRMKVNENIDFDELVKRLTYPGSGLDKGQVVQVIAAIGKQMALEMASGNSVTIDGISTGQPHSWSARFPRNAPWYATKSTGCASRPTARKSASALPSAIWAMEPTPSCASVIMLALPSSRTAQLRASCRKSPGRHNRLSGETAERVRSSMC